jgi:hypothetical protein
MLINQTQYLKKKNVSVFLTLKSGDLDLYLKKKRNRQKRSDFEFIHTIFGIHFMVQLLCQEDWIVI